MTVDDFFITLNKLRSNKTLASNMFFNKEQIEILLKDEKVCFLQHENSLLVTKEEECFTRLYFAATDLFSLGESLASLPATNKPLIADIIGKSPSVIELANILSENAFTLYSVFARMKTTSPSGLAEVEISEVTKAVEKDLDSIMLLLNSEFDPFSAHLPKKEEICLALKKGEIQVIRKENEIAGFAFFELVANRHICLRYFIVNKNYRMQGVGKTLLAHGFRNRGQGTLFSLWVALDNPALMLYEKYNFKQDGLCDYIMIRKGE